MRLFAARELRAFLKAVDRHALTPSRLVVIGGAAAALSFRATSGTADIDTANNTTGLREACEHARRETGWELPLGPAGVFDGPYEYESRLKRVSIRGLRNLQVLVPEKHDWALMKIVRLIEKDIEDIREVAGRIGLDPSILLDRFLSEMTHVIGRRETLVLNFLAMMEELFGKAEADRMEKAIRSHRHWKSP
jgi:hypothetical protein